jgi:hypothetical protein
VRPSRPQPIDHEVAAEHFQRNSWEEGRPSSWAVGAAIGRGSLLGAVVGELGSSRSRHGAEAGRERPCAGAAA